MFFNKMLKKKKKKDVPVNIRKDSQLSDYTN